MKTSLQQVKRVTPAQTVGRAALLLRIVASGNVGNLRLIDIAEAAGMDKSTTHRLLQRLVQEGMLVRNTARGYRLGPLLYELGLAALPATNLVEAANAGLQKLAQQTGDMVFLVMRSGFETVCASRLAGHYPIQTMTRSEGDRHPLGMGAGGLALLAALSDADIKTVIAAIKPRLAAYQCTEPMLYEAISRARASGGIAIDEGTAALDVCAIGKAIHNAANTPIGAIFIASIRHRMIEARRKQIIKQVIDCVQAIELNLGRV